jgi:DNA-directed RNA polymerase specialized sigma24 family protein
MDESNSGTSRVERQVFPNTHWSVVLAAGRSDTQRAHAALSHLCESYWSALYAYVRQRGHSPEDAQDLTQTFFARLLARNTVAQADPERGRFRSFLLASLKNFLAHEW